MRDIVIPREHILDRINKINKIDIAAKRHKIHKNNNLHVGVSNSYGR